MDPTGPARSAFNGGGSYGNGAAMRAHPVALAHRATLAWKRGNGGGGEGPLLAEEVEKMAMVTHAHKGE